MAHTPGPWRALPEHGRIVLNGSAIYGVADITGDYANWNPDDLRLMAAAPEMLDALKVAADAIDYAQAQVDSENDRHNLLVRLGQVQRVIAKAEGQGG